MTQNLFNGNPAVMVAGDLLKIHDSTFERNVLISPGSYWWSEGGAVLTTPYAWTIVAGVDKIYNLTFIGNASYRDTGHPAPLIHANNSDLKVSGCLFRDNLMVSKNYAGNIGLISNPVGEVGGSGYQNLFVLRNSTVVSNRVVVTLPTTATAVYAAPFLTRGISTLVNDTFLDNTVTFTKDPPSGCSVYAARSALAVMKSSWNETSRGFRAARLIVENCTFAGETALPDVVEAGDEHTGYRSFVGNSILWATGAGAAVPRVKGYSAGTSNGVDIARCVVRAPELLGANTWRLDAVFGNDPHLETLGFVQSSDVIPVMRAARQSFLSYAYDVRRASGYNRHGYGIGSGSYCDRIDNSVKSTDALIADALGNARPTGGFLLGAMQSTANAVRARPANGGTVNGEAAIYGTIPASVTAAAKAGYTFHSWRDAEGTLLSTEATYAPVPSASGEIYCEAVFTPDDNALTLAAGDDIQEAIDTLAYCDGDQTLTLGAGRYPICKQLGVRQKGKLTVKGVGEVLLSGDPAGLAYWVNDKGAAKLAADGSNLPVFAADGTFNEPQPEAGELYWKTAMANMTSRTTWLVNLTSGRDDAGAGTTLCFSNVTFSLGGLLVGRAETTFDHCRILACGASADTKIVDCRTNLTMNATTFAANYGRGITSGKYITSGYTKRHTCLWDIRDSVFRLNAGGSYSDDVYHGPCINGINADVTAADTAFVSNVASTANSSSLIVCQDLTTVSVSGCTFSDNLYTNTANPLLFGPYAGSLSISKSLFCGNRQYLPSFTWSSAAGNGRTCTWGAMVGSAYLQGSVYNSSFVSNLVDIAVTSTVTASNAVAAVLGFRHGAHAVNSHFEGNVTRVHAPAREGLTCVNCTVLAGGQGWSVVTGSSFYDNDVDCDLFVSCHSTSYNWYAQNCIFWGDDADYVPFAWADAATDRAMFWNCLMRNAPDNTSGDAKTVVTYYGCQSGDPKFGPLAWKDGRCHRPLTRGSAADRKGTPIGLNSSGVRVFWRSDAKDWRQCNKPWNNVGEPVAYATDMYGTYPRRVARPDLGPVQQTIPPGGLAVIFR